VVLIIIGDKLVDEVLENAVSEVFKADTKVGITVEEIEEGWVLILDQALEEVIATPLTWDISSRNKMQVPSWPSNSVRFWARKKSWME
jgi:hypothetical protein